MKTKILTALSFLLFALSLQLRAQTYVTAPITGTPAPGSYYNYSNVILGTGFNFSGSAGSFNAYTVSSAVGCVTLATTPTASQNYVMTSVPRVSGITTNAGLSGLSSCNLMQTVAYFDGLGRPLQTVQVKGSPAGNDVVQPFAYDAYGREQTKYLPYAITSGASDGSYKSNALTPGAGQAAFYASPPAGVSAVPDPYAQINYETSPLSRPVEQGDPGAAWQLSNSGVSGSGHTVKMVYTLNNSISFASDSINGRQVALYNATINSDGSRTLAPNGFYPATQLSVTVSKDENWTSGRAGTVEEYKDKLGHVVLKRTYNYTTVVQVLSTYYVYDDLGMLSFVLSPASNADADGTISQTTLDNLCYQYQYDERGRMIQKKIPGKGWEYMVYNLLDQVIYSCDANQRANSQWGYAKYDCLGRVIMTGVEKSNTSARATLQSYVTSELVANLFPEWESATPGSGVQGYTNNCFPNSANIVPLVVTYYDDYSFQGQPATVVAPTSASVMTRGVPTATKTAVLTNNTYATQPDMLWSVYYYDDLGRSSQSYVQHYLGGTLNANNYDVTSTTYNFNNTPTTITRKHYNTANSTLPLVTVANTYIYDNMGRKLKSWEQITNGSNSPTTKTLIAQKFYNEIGQVINKQLHSTDSLNFYQNMAYAYNERGWLQTSSAPLFAMQLYYNTGTNKQYNGNIAYQYWGTPGNLNNNYTYTYDKLNRLKSGISADNYKETGINYDVMGNITNLSRYQANTLIDNLTYSYSSTNQLQNIVDASGSNTGLVNGTTTYSYDSNGNLLSNTNTTNNGNNKSFTYNVLNLPIVATIPTGTITYTYDATGNKLRKVTVLSGVTKTTDYINGLEYDNSTTAIGFIQTEEGKAVPVTGGTYDYTYYLGDNLGNTRNTFGTKTGAAVSYQQDDYYPFGLEINRSVVSPKNEYLYNKKELQEELTLYDYGARFYDPVNGRWNVVDRVAEKSRRLSPYNYGEDNPIKNIDLEGDSIFEVGKGIQNDKVFNEGLATMRRTFMGKNEYDKYANSSSTDVYMSHGEGGDEILGTLANLRDHDEVTNDNHMSLNSKDQANAGMSNLDGLSVKKGIQVDAMEVNTKQENGLDKYDVAFTIFHEMRAHMDNNKGTGDDQHKKFGNTGLAPGLSLYDAKGNQLYRPGSDAYNFLRQLLTIKIKDGNGTELNKKDLQEMVNYLKDHQKKKQNDQNQN